MKKIFIICIFLLGLLISSSCSENEFTKETSTYQNHPEISGDISEIKISESISTTMQTETTTAETITSAEEINNGEIDEYSYISNFENYKFIYFTDCGRYYLVDIGGRDSANYVLCFENNDGISEILTETEDCAVEYSDNDSLYLSRHRSQNVSEKYKLEGNTLIPIDNYPFDLTKDSVFANIPDNADKYLIYDDKIFYDYYDREGISYYDTKTGETVDFNSGKIGIINNGCMYYTYYKESNKLLRFDLLDYKYKVVCEIDKSQYLLAFDFYKDSILYSSDNFLYRKDNYGENLIFSADDFFKSKGYEIRNIQCEDNRIFINIGAGAFYQCIMEIDIDGNVIEVIHED